MRLVLQTMSTPGVWSNDDLNHILKDYGAFIIERQGTDIDDALSSLQTYGDNIYVSIFQAILLIQGSTNCV